MQHLDIISAYNFFKSKSSDNPEAYQYTTLISQKLQALNDKGRVDIMSAILGFIYYHYIIEVKKTNPSISNEELEKKVLHHTGKNIIFLPYGGKTFDGGKGTKHLNIDSNTKFPEDLKRIITAYIFTIT